MTISQDPRDHWTGSAAVQMGFAGPSFWADAITIQLARLDRGAAALRDRVPHPDTPAPSAEPYRSMIRPLQLDAYFLVFALRGLLAVADLYGKQIDRAAAAAARDRFDREAAGTKLVRDVLAHFDDYVVGRGRRSDVAADGQWWLPVGVDRERNEYVVRVGNQTIELRRAAAAGHRLAQDLEAIAVAASRD